MIVTRLLPLSVVSLMLSALTLVSCSYEESMQLCKVEVQLQYPANSISAYAGAPVLLTDATASVFVDSTNTEGKAFFQVPPGIYQVSSSDTYLTYDYRYILNGVKSQLIISPDSSNQIQLPLTVSTKRIVH